MIVYCLDLSEFMKYNFNVSEAPVKIEWMCGAQTNICYNALGIHKAFIIWGSLPFFGIIFDCGGFPSFSFHLKVIKFKSNI